MHKGQKIRVIKLLTNQLDLHCVQTYGRVCYQNPSRNWNI